MFSLIITIISIALVAALALATLYYGGEAWTRGTTAWRDVARLMNEGVQATGNRFRMDGRESWKAMQRMHSQRTRFA